MDVISLEKCNQHYRILLDVKGRFQAHKINPEEAKFKLCKVVRKAINKKKIPNISTHDGRTVRYPHPDIALGDTVKLDIATGAVQSVIKLTNGATVMLVG